ncbi:NADH:ubiquinone oxidoreductase subunit N, partial [Candidatus Sumerlaeota bacterium]|nr:NADH:ubiquinone oxidoreductase subunit N [Candidatus Sumerlaeota bacterium]
AAFGVLASVASAYYYLRVIVRMFMEEPKGGKSEPAAPLEIADGSALFVCSLGIFLFAIFPMIFLG